MKDEIQVLVSCMHQNDAAILKRSNIRGAALVVNQCDYDRVDTSTFSTIINTTERGLSKSRNMALKNSTGDICLICDDDEILYDSYEILIQQAYIQFPDADIIAFQIKDAGKSYSPRSKRLNYLTVLKIASWQITFRKNSIINSDIWFDETLGSGVSKAGGEEIMFLYDCLRKNLKIYYYPVCIGRMIVGNSQWFHGFTEEFFFDRGVFTRKLMGLFAASIYGLYYLVFKYKLYKKDISVFRATRNLYKGMFA